MTKLLSPAGREEIAYAALDSGADAVYVGTRALSRRTADYELDDDAIRRCTDHALALGKEVHVALNIHYQESQLPLVMEKVRLYREMGVPLIIVLDIGFIQLIHETYPDLRLCASVSAGISNAAAAAFYKSLGCTQFVAQLNATPAEVRRIKDQVDIDVEVFCHGNVDFNQCGRCWMSTYVQQEKRLGEDGSYYYFMGSLHRGGGCYRICQHDWDLCEGSGAVLRENAFADAWHWEYRVNRVAEFVESGVDYFKIQGRTYGHEVVVDITRFYRRLLDQILPDPAGFTADDALQRELQRIEATRARQELRYTHSLLGEAHMPPGDSR